jgi:hypothetical protein
MVAPITHPTFFSPYMIAVRTSAEPGQLIPSIRRRIAEVEPHATIATAATMETVVSGSLSRRRAAVVVAGTFAGSHTRSAASSTWRAYRSSEASRRAAQRPVNWSILMR